MLDQLIKLVKDNAGEAIVSNPAVPNEKNELAINTTANSIFDSLKNQIGSGNLGSIMDMFTGGGDASSSSLINGVSSGVIGDLMAKVGLDKAAASNVVNQLVPLVMNKLKSKTNDPSDSSIDLDGIINSLGGKGGNDILGSIKGIFG
jgi:hypothetical protein